jgi:hypothetical protein
MYLSEAILLGSTLDKLEPYDINHCALGMAGNTMGVPKAIKFLSQEVPIEGILASQNERIGNIIKIWPWLRCMDKCPEFMNMTLVPWNLSEKYTYGKIIMAMFDYNVCKGEILLEQLIDYVRSVEPECGECGYFNCQCKNLKAMITVSAEEKVAYATV